MTINKEFSLVKQGWNSVYAYAPALEECESETFPVTDILANTEIRNEHLISMETITSGKIQEFNRILDDFKHLAFAGLGPRGAKRGALSLEEKIRPAQIEAQDGELQIRASNDELYFCANIRLIRQTLEEAPSMQTNDIDGLAQGLQKALVSYGLRNDFPVLFVISLLEDADKPVMCKADRYLWRNRDKNLGDEQFLAAEY